MCLEIQLTTSSQAEEDALRIANEKLHQASVPSGPSVDRSRKQDFIDPNVLAECVKKIGKSPRKHANQLSISSSYSLSLSFVNFVTSSRCFPTSYPRTRYDPLHSTSNSTSTRTIDSCSYSSKRSSNPFLAFPSTSNVIISQTQAKWF